MNNTTLPMGFPPRKPEILSPSMLDFSSLALNPLTPLNGDTQQIDGGAVTDKGEEGDTAFVSETCKMDSMFHGGQEEMTYTKTPKCWYVRKLSVLESGQTEDALFVELSFSAQHVRKDAKNKYAWSHRQWVLEALGKGYVDELGFCDEILARKHDKQNKLVWDQRCFAVKKCLTSGLMIIRSSEVTFATNHILRNPENENPWRYLRFLCMGEMDALARNVHLQWALKCVFVEARERKHAVTADSPLHENKGHAAVLFDSVNKRGCLFALDLVSDLLSHGYQPHKEVVDAIKDLFQEFDELTPAKRVDSVLQKHRMEVMELSADFSRVIENMRRGMEANGQYTPLSDHLKNPSKTFIWSKDRWLTAPSGRVVLKYFPGSYSQLCGVAGFSQRSVCLYPEDPCMVKSMEKEKARIDREERRDIGNIPPDFGGENKDTDAVLLNFGAGYKNLPELLRMCCWEITFFPDFDMDSHTREFMFVAGHKKPFVWQVRRLVIHARKLDLQKEVKILKLLSKENSENYLYWHQRRWVSEKIGKTAAKKELEFTDSILSKDAYNYHAWSHRKWVLEVLGVGWGDELEYCNKFLAKDSSNCFAWNQRYFVARVAYLTTGKMLGRVVEYATNAIKAEPENEMPWTFLQSLMELENCCCFGWLERYCGLVLKKLAEAKYHFFPKCAARKKGIVNALKMVVFALRNCPESVHMFRSFWPSQEELEHDISQILKSIDVTWI